MRVKGRPVRPPAPPDIRQKKTPALFAPAIAAFLLGLLLDVLVLPLLFLADAA